MGQGEQRDLKWRNSDLREQLGSAIDTVIKLHDQCESVKNKLLFHLDQGQGLTQEQLVAVFEEINKLFPKRIRTVIVRCSRDTNGDGDCGQPLCPNCGNYR